MVSWIPIVVGLIIGGLVIASTLPQIPQPPPGEGGGDFTQMLNQLFQIMFMLMFMMMFMQMMTAMMG
jgi:hypothetical protein